MSKSDETPRELLDVNLLKNINLLYKAPIIEGMQKVYDWYANEHI